MELHRMHVYMIQYIITHYGYVPTYTMYQENWSFLADCNGAISKHWYLWHQRQMAFYPALQVKDKALLTYGTMQIVI